MASTIWIPCLNQLKNELESLRNIHVHFSDGIVKRWSGTGLVHIPPYPNLQAITSHDRLTDQASLQRAMYTALAALLKGFP